MNFSYIKIFTFLLLCSSLSYSQNYNWITPGKNYLKVYIIENGIHRLEKNDFLNAGVNIGSVDPRSLKIFYKGSEINCYVKGQEDGIFNDSDYVDFYAERNYGGLTNTYDHNVNVSYTTFEYYNPYSDTNIYWIDWGGTNGLRYSDYSFSAGSAYSNNSFNKLIHRERDLVYSQGEQASESDFRYFTTDKFLGQGWYWSQMNNNQTVSDTFSTPLLFSTGGSSKIKIFAYPKNQSLTYFNEHRFIVTINGNLVDTIRSDNFNRIDVTLNFPSTFLNSTGTNNISIKYNSITGYTGSMYFDYYEISYPSKFTFRNYEISFKTEDTDTNSVLYKVTNFSQYAFPSIYDITNNLNLTNYFFGNDTLFFYGRKNSQILVNDQFNSRKPLRVKLKSVPNLISSADGFNYVLIYNKIFQPQAELLRSHRQSFNGYSTLKADIEDIYDIFNYGTEDPAALKNFIKNVYQNFPAPKLKFVALLGRASLDPKKNLTSSVNFLNLIPTYGYPPSDGYFGNFNSTKGNYIQQVSIGRIPAYSIEEADVIVNKIISYDQLPQETWMKNFIMISGGSSYNEQTQFKQKSLTLINTYIAPPPLSGNSHLISRGDTSGFVTFNYRDSIKSDINNGGILVNFIGHAGSQNWEVGMEEPSSLNNQEKLPFVLSMTCFTGKNSEPAYRGFGEKFLYLENKGAIGFIGTTGWSFASSGNTFNENIIKALKTDTLRSLGEIYRYASLLMSPDSNSFTSKHTFNCYNLIGDPGTVLKYPKTPEFYVSNNSYQLSNDFPLAGENISLKLSPLNLGLNADSCKIAVNIFKDEKLQNTFDSVVYNFGFTDTLNFNFRVDSIGQYRIKVKLDTDNWYPGEDKNNNKIDIPIVTKNISYLPVFPANDQVVQSDTVLIKGINPSRPANSNVRVLLEIDTTSRFDSPVKEVYYKDDPAGLSTVFRIPVTLKINDLIYFWRTNTVIDNEPSGWSSDYRFVYKITDKAGVNDVEISKHKNSQFANDQAYNISFKFDTSKSLSSYTGNLFVRSFNDNEFEASFFLINNKQIFIDNRQNQGLNVVRVSKATGSILSYKNFRMTSVQSSDSIVTHLNTFDTTHILMLCKSQGVSGGTFLQTNAKNKLKSLGSIYCDSVGTFGWWDTWSLISYPSNGSYTTSENFFRFPGGGAPPNGCINNQCPSQSSMNVTFYRTEGNITSVFGPALGWENFSWTKNLFPFSSLVYNLYGIKKHGEKDLLFGNAGSLLNLSSIDALLYPEIEAQAQFTISDTGSFRSSELNSVQINYSSPAEIVVDENSFLLNNATVNEGDSLTATVHYGNIGLAIPDKIVTAWLVSSPNGRRLLRADTLIKNLQTDSIFTSQITFNTRGTRCCNQTIDTATLYFETYLINSNEYYTFNNTGKVNFFVLGDSIPPLLKVTYDGREIINGDYITSKPNIEMRVFENSNLRIEDTTNVKVFLSNTYVPFTINGTPNPQLNFLRVDSPDLQAIVQYTPELSEGEHKLTYIALDNFGNAADTVNHFVNINNDLKIYDVNTFPNPMRDETNFMFMLGGESRPFNLKVKIFTVAGRMIKEINYPANIGHNQIYWDGRDSDGDKLANGVYLYKIITEGERNLETTIQKLVILK